MIRVYCQPHLAALPVDGEEAGRALEHHGLRFSAAAFAAPEVGRMRGELQAEDGGVGEVVLLAQLVLPQVLFPSLYVSCVVTC